MTLDDGSTLTYDYLVIAVGSENAAALKTNDRFQSDKTLAEMKSLSDRLKTINKLVVVGGGPVGVESACEIAIAYPKVSVALVHSNKLLLESGSKVLFSDKFHMKLSTFGLHFPFSFSFD